MSDISSMMHLANMLRNEQDIIHIEDSSSFSECKMSRIRENGKDNVFHEIPKGSKIKYIKVIYEDPEGKENTLELNME